MYKSMSLNLTSKTLSKMKAYQAGSKTKHEF